MSESIHLKYLITNERDNLWGLTISTVGYQHINAQSPYPPQNHPTSYLFSTDKGRVLEEYQLIYITQGNGEFVSDNQKQTAIKEGSMFLLFPGEWHSYKPDKQTGWDEYWIGFSGINIDNRILNGFFNKQKPIFSVGIRQEVVQLYKQAIEIAELQEAGFQQMLAGIVNYLLGIAYVHDKRSTFSDPQIITKINKAKVIMLETFKDGATPQSIAQRVNMSYSWFRRIFKQYTGFSPAQYIVELKIQKSKELLTNTLHTSQEIAFEAGFDNSDYFCTVFKKRTGMTPVKYRQFTQGKNL